MMMSKNEDDLIEHFHHRQHEYSHTGETPFECKIPGGSMNFPKKIAVDLNFSQIVIRSSHQSSSWRGTFWSTARQRLFSVMSVIEHFGARIIWGITRKFTTLGRPSTLAPMIPVPAPTTQWPVSENTRLVVSQKLSHKSCVTKVKSPKVSFAFALWRHSRYASVQHPLFV